MCHITLSKAQCSTLGHRTQKPNKGRKTHVCAQQLLCQGLVALSGGEVQGCGALGAIDCVHAIKQGRQQRVGAQVEQHRQSLLVVVLHSKVDGSEARLGAHVNIPAAAAAAGKEEAGTCVCSQNVMVGFCGGRRGNC